MTQRSPRKYAVWQVVTTDHMLREEMVRYLRAGGYATAHEAGPIPDEPMGLIVSTLTIGEAEHRVLRELCVGGTSKEIARRLHISPRTVDHHIQDLKRKLGVDSRPRLVLKAVLLGLVPWPDDS